MMKPPMMLLYRMEGLDSVYSSRKSARRYYEVFEVMKAIAVSVISVDRCFD